VEAAIPWIASFVFLVGLVAITVGAWGIAPEAGLIVGGFFAVVVSTLLRRGIGGPTRPTA